MINEGKKKREKKEKEEKMEKESTIAENKRKQLLCLGINKTNPFITQCE